MRLPCPFCGLRDAEEFSYEGLAEAAARPPLDAPAEDWVRAVYLRPQPKGPAEELWRHRHGCGAWVAILRDNVTHEVGGARLFHPGAAAALGADARAAGAPGVAAIEPADGGDDGEGPA